jgi:hypothetical protein
MVSTGAHDTSAIFLETLWSRLASMHLLNLSAFGEDLQMEVVHRFIDAEFKESVGWGYHIIPLPRSDAGAPVTWEWTPDQVSQSAFSLVMTLLRGGLSASDLMEGGDELAKAITELESAGICGRDASDESVHLLLKEPMAVALSDDRHFVGENNSGRMERWLKNQRFEEQGVRPLIVLH